MLESLFDKVAFLKDWNFTEKRLQCRRFPVNIENFLKTPPVVASAISLFIPLVPSCACARQFKILMLFLCSKDFRRSPKILLAFLETGVNRKMIHKSLFFDYKRLHNASTIKKPLNQKAD